MQQCFESLLQLLDWSWTASYHMMEEVEGVKGEGYQAALAEMSQLVYISRACLRLLTIYVTEIYPDGGKQFYKNLMLLYIFKMYLKGMCVHACCAVLCPVSGRAGGHKFTIN